MRTRGSVAGPVILIAIGGLFLVHAVSPDFEIADMIARSWPFVLIAWGVVAFLEACIVTLRRPGVPVAGITAGGWFFVLLICVVGLVAGELHRPESWWRQMGWEHGVNAFGQEHDFTIDTTRTAAGKAPHIILESFRGDAKVTAVDDTDLTVGGNKTVRAFENGAAERANAATPVEVIVEGNRIRIRCNQDRAGPRVTVTTDLQLSVPKGSSIEAKGTLGDFDISGIAGDVVLSSENAGVRVEDIGGNVTIETRNSDLVRCTNVAGKLTLRGKGTDVEISKVAGQVDMEGDFDGSVSFRDLAKPVRVENMRTVMDIQQLPGELRMGGGNIEGQNLVGPVKMDTHATDVTLDGFTSGLELTVDKGDVDLRPSRLPMPKMAVHNRSGDINLAVPQGAGFVITAATDHGEINNDLGESLKQRTEGGGATLEGSIGNGPELKLETGRGSITLQKADAPVLAPPMPSMPSMPKMPPPMPPSGPRGPGSPGEATTTSAQKI